ncbi:MAG: hypothetical protein HY868_09940 [Chloroflexi bacterium]|nr:hypothetical protein [Chloroflexota bacterium]
MASNLVIDRSALPLRVLEWLESDAKKSGILLYREENDQVVLERLENIDPAMLTRVRANIQRYHSALQRLAEA